MNKKELNNRLAELKNNYADFEVDNLAQQLIIFDQYGGVFAYANWCERNFEANLRNDYKRKTTYTSDFSIAEWCVPIEGIKSVLDTFTKAIKYNVDNIEWMAEIIIVTNMKAWEHNARGNHKWATLYSELYLFAKDLYFDWYDGNDEAIQYYYDYVD